MNDNFSWKRFGLLVRSEMAGERRGLLLKLGGFVVFCVVMYMLWNIKVIFGGGTVEYNGGLGYVAPRLFIAIGMGFIVYFNLSGSFKRFFSRGKASAALMLPAAGSEKFLYASLLNLIVVPVVLIAIAVLNDMLWAHLLGFKNICQAISMYSEQISSPEQAVLFSSGFNFANVISTFSGMAFFFLGAVVFRRHQFLLTLLVNFVLTIPYLIYLQIVVLNDPQSMTERFLWMNTDTGIWTIAGSGALFTLLWIFVAWRRFSTLQITK